MEIFFQRNTIGWCCYWRSEALFQWDQMYSWREAFPRIILPNRQRRELFGQPERTESW